MNVYTRLPQKELDATKMSMATGHVTIKSINIMRTQSAKEYGISIPYMAGDHNS